VKIINHSGNIYPGAKFKTMMSLLKELMFDKYLVKRMRNEKVNPGILYQQLVSGKITLQEFLAAGK